MPNRNYVKGRAKEYKTVHELKDRGYIAFRSAGSHSPFDVVGIHKRLRKVVFVQCKPDRMSENAKQKLLDEHNDLNGKFEVCFIVI